MPDTTTTADDTTTSKRAKAVYNRVIVQLADDNSGNFRIVSDLGPTTTAKAQSAKRALERAGQTRLAVVYWVG